MTAPHPPLTPDAVADHWSLRVLPVWARPYSRLMRLERPAGWYLLFWPCAFSSLLASIALDGPAQWGHLLLFWIGSIIMRSAGCTLNDIADRDIDAKVARTAMRPIPSGEVTPKQAAIFLVGLLALGFLVLIQFNMVTIITGIASLVLVAAYPFAKRVTNWPQVVLGMVFAWGALVGWTAQTGSMALPMVLVYLASAIWILGYDTIYAFQDYEDDALIGVGSSAQALGDKATLFVAACYGATVLLMAVSMVLVSSSWPAYVGLAATAIHFGWQVTTLDLKDGLGCFRRFKSNIWVGAMLAGGLLLAALM